MLGFIRSQFPHIPTYCVMGDTGFEHVRRLRQWNGHAKLHGVLGWNCMSSAIRTRPIRRWFVHAASFLSAQFRQCTSDLKRSPIHKFIRQLPHPVLINCMGMRPQESVQRARQEPWSQDEALSKAGRTVFNWLPIFTKTMEGVLQWHWKERVPLRLVYVPESHRDGTRGGYLRRFSCRVCIFATDHDLRMIHEHDREAFELVSESEQQSGFTIKAGRTLIRILSQPLPATREVDRLDLFAAAG